MKKILKKIFNKSCQHIWGPDMTIDNSPYVFCTKCGAGTLKEYADNQERCQNVINIMRQTSAMSWQAFFAGALVFINIILVIITIVYVIRTGSIAASSSDQASTTAAQFKLNMEQFQQNNRPFVFMDDFKINPDDDENVLYSLEWKNSGAIPAKCHFEKACLFYEGGEEECSRPADIYIFPGIDGQKMGQLDFSDNFQRLKELINSKMYVRITFKLTYWSINDKYNKSPFHYENIIDLFIDPEEPNSIRHNLIYTKAD